MQAKLRSVYMTDEDFEACQRVAGHQRFSAWARQVLLERAGLSLHIPGAAGGGRCRNEKCGYAPDAWWFLSTQQQYLCDACVQEFLPKLSHFVINRRPMPPREETVQQKMVRLLKELSEIFEKYPTTSSREEIFQQIANAKTE